VVHGYAWGCLAAEGLGGHVGAGPRRAAEALAGLRISRTCRPRRRLNVVAGHEQPQGGKIGRRSERVFDIIDGPR